MNEMLQDKLREIERRKSETLEQFCEAFLAETGLQPSDVVMCLQKYDEPLRFNWWFEPKSIFRNRWEKIRDVINAVNIEHDVKLPAGWYIDVKVQLGLSDTLEPCNADNLNSQSKGDA